MEEKILKKAIVIVYFAFSATVILIQFFAGFFGFEVHLSGVLYWLLFFGWVYFVWQNKIESSFSFIIALSLFALSAFFVILGMRTIGEIIMRVSFVFWIFGILHWFIELKK